MKSTGVVFRLFQHAGKYRIFMILSWLFSGLGGILNLSPYLCIYFVVRELIRSGGDSTLLNNEALTFYGWLAVKAAMFSFMLYGISLLFSHLAAFNLIAEMRIKILRHLEKLPLGFHFINPSGKLKKIIEKNCEDLDNFVAHQLPDTIQAVAMALTFLGSIVWFDWRLALLCMIPTILGFISMNFLLRGESRDFLKKYQESLAEMSNSSVEYVRGISVVKVFGQTIFSFKRFYDSIMNYKKFITDYVLSMEKGMSFYVASINGVFFFLIPGGILFYQWSKNREAFVLSFIFFLIFTPLIPLLMTKIVYRSSRQMLVTQALDTLEGLFDEKVLIQPKNPKTPDNYDINFDSVTFRYEENSPDVIHDLSFFSKQGTFTALVGPSGGGKTTIANLICRFWDAQKGKITIGGVDVKDMNSDQWLEQVSFVFQDTSLFKMSIAENVGFGKQNASQEEVIKALKLAQCKDIIDKLPDGVDTIIGTKGVYLSGGEMQRIALARAIIKDAPVVVLDEATAFADPENERKIQKALNVIMEKKTVFMIAHRLSTITQADQILVLDKGRITQSGDHKTLIDNNGLYAKMFREYQTSASWKIGGDGDV